MTVVKTTLIASSVVAAVAALPAVAAPSAPVPAATVADGLSASTSALRGHGELAVIHAHHLYLLGGPVDGVERVALADQATQPKWSHDGKWLTVITHKAAPASNPYAEEPETVWVIQRSGAIERRLTPLNTPVYDVDDAWSPRADRVAVLYNVHHENSSLDRGHLETAGPVHGAATALGSAYQIFGFAWSPDGRRIAADLNRYGGTPAAWHSAVEVFRGRGGPSRTVSKSDGNVLPIAGWWPDGSGVLAWLDYQGSSSIAADGLPLLDIAVKTGDRRRLTKSMLQYPQWLSTSRVGDKVAFVAGGDRELTHSHKHVVVCTRNSCHDLTQPSGAASFDPTYATTGRLALVRDRAVSPRNGFGISYVSKTQASGGVVIPSGGSVRVPIPAAGASDPVWGRDGSMLVVRKQALWLLNAWLTKATKVVGPIQVPSNFYGFVPWRDSFAWSDAVA